jgi:hypothetical protein
VSDAVRAQGSMRSFGYEAPKQVELGDAGRNWSQIGYRADVAYLLLNAPVRPQDEWLAIQPLLPSKYSPLHLEFGWRLPPSRDGAQTACTRHESWPCSCPSSQRHRALLATAQGLVRKARSPAAPVQQTAS